MKKSNSFKPRKLSLFERIKQRRLDCKIVQKVIRVNKLKKTFVLDIETDSFYNWTTEPSEFLD